MFAIKGEHIFFSEIDAPFSLDCGIGGAMSLSRIKWE